MAETFRRLFDADFMPHGMCYLWQPEIVWLHAVSDATIALAYFTIPFLLVYVVRRRSDIAFPWVFVMFGAFILLCGTTHLLAIWTIWNGAYWLTGAVKAATGVVSLATAVALVPVVPKVLQLVGPGELRAANEALQAEVDARRRAEAELTGLNEALEARVAERTAELEDANGALRELNRTLEARVEERTAQARALATQLTLAEQRERGGLARVLHDDLQQSLYAIQIKLKVARARADPDGRAADQFDAADALMTQAVDTTRRLTVDLSPVVLEGAGLDEALRWLVLYMEDRFGLAVDLAVDGALTVPGEAMRVLLFQSVREALFNVAKYAGTDRATVRLGEADGHLTVEVADDGNGFDAAEVFARPPALSGGFGLRHARERLGLFGAALAVTSAPAAGTRVRITIPVAALQEGGLPS